MGGDSPHSRTAAYDRLLAEIEGAPDPRDLRFDWTLVRGLLLELLAMRAELRSRLVSEGETALASDAETYADDRIDQLVSQLPPPREIDQG